ncbi:nucleotidyl transferase AbiEii/AbiGii toxin family protein [Streptomyces sp. RB6PN25]|uniref:Nucleotidyl transferase AbiEii/AbiGii toxin family protein n=1 Tax=Streptomyces humicola TaxID=2953240 RepID=A0ABT1PXS6_9ACTN|nr:nucleotidyl transferase AbiEii/AbiGii toxin family protein [Streptomyces humicola]MCQ4082486.1 nucleotidyl transferase AbiEii/AbiGii toxin family protein [Streptomyces humicola]
MSESWERFSHYSEYLPQLPLEENQRERLGFPATLRPISDPEAVQPGVFDPSLKQHQRAFRAADPRYDDPDKQTAWRVARRNALDVVIAAVAASPWADSLVLRGSVLLAGWCGPVAREPGDLDFIVVPASWKLDDPRTKSMFEQLTSAVHERTCAQGASGLRFVPEEAASDEIWTYDRVPGRRLILPWRTDHVAGGVVQLDLVFNEHLPVPPEPTRIPTRDGRDAAHLLAVTPELSLAWKLQWLVTDMWPQGKDLYDAALLAERYLLRYSMLRDVLSQVDPYHCVHPLHTHHLLELDLEAEWGEFLREYPHITGSYRDYQQRLVTALAPTFAAAGVPENGRDTYALLASWLSPSTEKYRPTLTTAAGALETVLARMAEDGIPLRGAIIITRELLGPDTHGLDDARDRILNSAAFAQHPTWARQNMSELDQYLESL